MKWERNNIRKLLCVTLVLAGILSFTAGEALADETMPAEEEETGEASFEGLTPEGNLTLVDDFGDEKNGKQFVTLVTRNGNYFYLIIDRDKDGDENVHLLNLVDERDLLELMEEAGEEFFETECVETEVETIGSLFITETKKEETEDVLPADSLTATKLENEQRTSKRKILLCILGAALFGCGLFLFRIVRKKKKEKKKMDPDDELIFDEEEEDLEMEDNDEK